MKTKILSGLICCLGIFSAKAQTITAPVGQSLTVTNPIDITVAGGSVNVPSDGSFNFGSVKILSTKTGNIFLGENAGNITTGSQNLFLGGRTGQLNTTGEFNVFVGFDAGNSNTSGVRNTYIGKNAGFTSTSTNDNVFIGYNSGYANTTGSNNLFLGTDAGYGNTTGFGNTFIGRLSGGNNTVGQRNMFLGFESGLSNTNGSYNVYIGYNAGRLGTSGTNNTFLGLDAGYFNTTGTSNTFVGSGSGNPATSSTITNATAIGYSAQVTTSNTIVLGNAATTITGQGLAAGASGLRFANLNASSAAVTSGGSNKVLSVDGSGNVVLVALAGSVTTTATNPVAESTWKNADGYLYNNSTNGVVINGAGLDGNALIVKGGVLSKEVNVKVEGAESWPDYVFKPSYKRMSLEEVEKFISINGHLPNVASATEMAATGNNLNKTDIKLLEKVEELTLYLLDMKKANDAQSAEIQSLKNQMNKLKKNRK